MAAAGAGAGTEGSRSRLVVAGVYETALYVADLARSCAFYQELFGLELVGGGVGADDRLTALRVGDRQVLLLFRQGASAGGASLAHDARGQTHVAFAVAAADIGAWERRLRDWGLAIERIIDWRPGVRSLYVRDPDRHLVEVATPGVWGDSL